MKWERGYSGTFWAQNDFLVPCRKYAKTSSTSDTGYRPLDRQTLHNVADENSGKRHAELEHRLIVGRK